MLHGASLTIVLAILWITLSGYTDKPALLWFGAASVVFAVALTVRMRILDRETVPFLRLPTLIPYYLWLGGQIVAANVAVVRAALSPEIDITPKMVRVPVRAKSDLAYCIYANSITLTPGTVTVEVEDDGFLVHALTADFTDPAGFAEMGARAASATDGRRRKT